MKATGRPVTRSSQYKKQTSSVNIKKKKISVNRPIFQGTQPEIETSCHSEITKHSILPEKEESQTKKVKTIQRQRRKSIEIPADILENQSLDELVEYYGSQLNCLKMEIRRRQKLETQKARLIKEIGKTKQNIELIEETKVEMSKSASQNF